MHTIKTRTLEAAFDRIIKRLEEDGVKEVGIKQDLYGIIPADEWHKFEKAPVLIGSLSDDIEEVNQMVGDPDSICTFVDFDRVASMLHAISQTLNPPD